MESKSKNKFLKPMALVSSVLGSLMAVGAVASADEISSVAVTTDQLQPIVSAVTDNIGVILPIAISIFGIFFGIKLIPKLIKMFKNG